MRSMLKLQLICHCMPSMLKLLLTSNLCCMSLHVIVLSFLGWMLLSADSNNPQWHIDVRSKVTKLYCMDVCMCVQVDQQLQDLSQYSDIAFTSRNGIHAVTELLQRLHGTPQAALQALQGCGAQCWALGADAEALTQLGLHNVQTPTEVLSPTRPGHLPVWMLVCRTYCCMATVSFELHSCIGSWASVTQETSRSSSSTST